MTKVKTFASQPFSFHLDKMKKASANCIEKRCILITRNFKIFWNFAGTVTHFFTLLKIRIPRELEIYDQQYLNNQKL